MGRAVAAIAHDRRSAETCDPRREPAGELHCVGRWYPFVRRRVRPT